MPYMDLLYYIRLSIYILYRKTLKLFVIAIKQYSDQLKCTKLHRKMEQFEICQIFVQS